MKTRGKMPLFDAQRDEYMALMVELKLRDPDAYEAMRQESRKGAARSAQRRFDEDVN